LPVFEFDRLSHLRTPNGVSPSVGPGPNEADAGAGPNAGGDLNVGQLTLPSPYDHLFESDPRLASPENFGLPVFEFDRLAEIVTPGGPSVDPFYADAPNWHLMV
jgi:hypothetical protein